MRVMSFCLEISICNFFFPGQIPKSQTSNRMTDISLTLKKNKKEKKRKENLTSYKAEIRRSGF